MLRDKLGLRDAEASLDRDTFVKRVMEEAHVGGSFPQATMRPGGGAVPARMDVEQATPATPPASAGVPRMHMTTMRGTGMVTSFPVDVATVPEEPAVADSRLPGPGDPT